MCSLPKGLEFLENVVLRDCIVKDPVQVRRIKTLACALLYKCSLITSTCRQVNHVRCTQDIEISGTYSIVTLSGFLCAARTNHGGKYNLLFVYCSRTRTKESNHKLTINKLREPSNFMVVTHS